MNPVLLLKYNKVTNDSFRRLSTVLQVKWGNLSHFDKEMDVLSYEVVEKYLSGLLPFRKVVVGDIFWPTGQHICRWCKQQKIRCFFLQHGQWIYIKNKKSPQFLPYCTMVYGDNVKSMTDEWPYGSRSKVIATGNPRYDLIIPVAGGDYVYFCPPVMKELVPNGDNKIHKRNVQLLQSIAGLDKGIEMTLHPHYREGNINVLRKLFPTAKMADPKADPLPLILKSSHVLTHRDSTTIMDAIACGKPSILLNFKGIRSFFPKEHFGDLAIECETVGECKLALSSTPFEVNTEYAQRVKPHLYLGNASMRIASLLV